MQMEQAQFGSNRCIQARVVERRCWQEFALWEAVQAAWRCASTRSITSAGIPNSMRSFLQLGITADEQTAACSPLLAPSSRESVVVSQACSVLDASLVDSTFWQNLFKHEEPLRFLQKAMKREAARDAAFARCVVESNPLRASVLTSPAASCSPPALTGAPREPSEQSPPFFGEASSGEDSQRGLADGASGRCGAEFGRRRAQTAADGHPAAAHAARRPSKAAWRSCGGDAPAASPWRAASGRSSALMAPLPAALAAQVAGFLPARDTARLGQVVSRASAVLRHAAAWEPLVLGRQDCGRLLRHLRGRDRFCLLRADEHPLPRGMGEVVRLELDLMDPDIRRPDEEPGDAVDGTPGAVGTASAGPAGAPAAGPRGLVFDPLDELCRRLRRGWFASAGYMKISNINVVGMDLGFLQHRICTFGRFPHLRLSMASDRYELLASREQLAPTSSVANARTTLRAGVARRPLGECGGASESSDLDADFVREHTAAFKSGDDFRFAHAPWRTRSGSLVRETYRALRRLHHREFGASQ
ncbi:unnamed protein product [Prorocentrum cordatum]|uniref:F-box domain-containing protein n=1 Tax=Prorocentrum cordatum TaxID=2364126 RepID=A0ABN9VY55_9DINO|nr:unnamed protein product [Polarella glacialis]